MGYQLITPPASEPVALPDAKAHLRVDIPDDDALITSLITMARRAAEQETNRSLISQQWKYTFDSFPGAQALVASIVPWGVTYSLPDNAILLEKGPVTAVSSITYLDMAGVVQTMPSTDYVADLTNPLARVTPVFGKIWPIPMPQIASCALTFTAGAADASTVPQEIKNWMLLRIGAMYENREEIVVGRGVVALDMPFVDGLLDPYKIVQA